MTNPPTLPILGLVLPLTSAVLYVVGAMLLRRSADFGVGFWRTAFVVNLIFAALVAPVWLLGGEFHASLLWQPAVVAILFMSGSILNFISLDRGDVSVATPVLGIKIILVALFSTLISGDTISPKIWAASALSTIAIALLNWTRTRHHHHVTKTILAAAGSAASYALFDVLVQTWSPTWQVGRFLPVMLGFAGIYTLGLIPFFPAPLSKISAPAWPWLVAGGVLIAIQSLLFVGSVAQFEHATEANVLYSSRGLWSVVAVWCIGHWFYNTEQQLGAGILAWRLVGSALMLVAILLVML
jgi:drug/metabolite transporter (DMT)-like permease